MFFKLLQTFKRHGNPYRRNRRLALILSVICLSSSLILTEQSKAGDLEIMGPSVNVPIADPAMMRAFKKAAEGLDGFLTKWRNPPAGAAMFSVKIGLRDIAEPPGYELVSPKSFARAEPVEWFWVNALRADGTDFVAEIDNAPDTVKHVKDGQTIRFTRKDIADWTYFQNGKIVGNATACPALAHADAEQRSVMRVRFGLVCD